MPKGEGVSYTPEGARQGTSREHQQPSFEERYSRFRAGEFTQHNEDGTETTYVEYRIGFNRGSANVIQAVADFCRSTSEAGYTKGHCQLNESAQACSPLLPHFPAEHNAFGPPIGSIAAQGMALFPTS